MQVKTMLAVAATALVPLGAAWATQPTGPQGTFLWNEPYAWPAFSTMDRNGDGIITRDEYAAATGTVPPLAAPTAMAPVAPAYVPCGPGTGVACAPVAYAPVVVQPAPAPRYSWHPADSNPPAPAK